MSFDFMRNSKLLTVLLFASCTLFFYITLSKTHNAMGDITTGLGWQEQAARKRADNYEKIPKEWLLPQTTLEAGKRQKKLTGEFIESLLDEETLRITRLDVADLLENIRNRSLTATRVTHSFCKRGAFAHQLNNNLLEIFFDIALQRAKELDDYMEEHGEPVGPLHGLPVSFKDQFHVKDVDTTMAYVGWIGTFEGLKGTGKEKVVESELVKELLSLGAVPMAKTSLVQTLWYGETNNNIIGYTMNPHNQNLSCGGSSGGEGAFQALRGSAIGFGTDVGGSVSIPSAFNGIYSIKPSHGRISMKDAANSSPGQIVIPTVVGIMGASIPSLKIMFQSLLSTKPWLRDPDVINIPWRTEIEVPKDEPLTFGFMQHDSIVQPHPPIARALQIVAEALKAKGHNMIPWEPPSHAESSKIHPSFTEADGAADVFHNIGLSGEPLIPELQKGFGTGPTEPTPLLDFYKNSLKLKDFRARYNSYWTSTMERTGTFRPADAVIMPVAPHAAVIPRHYFHYTYSSLMNVLDYTTVVIPVTTANKNIDVFNPDHTPLSEKDEKNWKAYNAEKYDGAPASIQVFCRRLEEEKVLSIAQIVVDALDEYRKTNEF